MKMNYFGLTAILAIAALPVWSQASLEDIDPRIVEHFGAEKTLEMVTVEPTAILKYTNYLAHAVQFIEITEKDISDLRHISEIRFKKGSQCTRPIDVQLASGNFNPLAFELNHRDKAKQYFRTNKEDQVMIAVPMSSIKANLLQ